MTERAVFYIDGFNLYHAIDRLKQNKLKWLDLAALADELIPSKSEHVEHVIYFSALATHRPTVYRHRIYVAALRARGVECVMGAFKGRKKKCRSCGAVWTAHEEKETDVNIAVRLVADAFLDRFDTAYIVSADTDLVPPLRTVADQFPAKNLVAVGPPRQNFGAEITAITQRQIRLRPPNLERNLLPAQMTSLSGSLLSRPDVYDP